LFSEPSTNRLGLFLHFFQQEIYKFGARQFFIGADLFKESQVIFAQAD